MERYMLVNLQEVEEVPWPSYHRPTFTWLTTWWHVWIAGSAYYDNVRPLSYPDADAVLICFDISRPDTLDSVLKKVSVLWWYSLLLSVKLYKLPLLPLNWGTVACPNGIFAQSPWPMTLSEKASICVSGGSGLWKSLFCWKLRLYQWERGLILGQHQWERGEDCENKLTWGSEVV